MKIFLSLKGVDETSGGNVERKRGGKEREGKLCWLPITTDSTFI